MGIVKAIILSVESGGKFTSLWIHLKNLLWGSITFSKLARRKLTMSVIETTLIALSVESGGKFSLLWIHLKDLLWGIITFGKLTGWEFTMSVVETTFLSS